MSEERLSIFVATPTMGEVPIQYAKALVEMLLKTRDEHPEAQIRMEVVIRKMHHRARTELTEEFLKSDCTHLLFVDDDNIPAPDSLNQLLALDLPAVSGLYFRRTPPYEPIIIMEGQEGIERRPDLYVEGATEPFKIHSCGMGFMLVKREVVEKVKDLGVAMFDVRGGMGEDIWFCTQIGAAGIELYLAPGVEIGHLGEKVLVTGRTFLENKS